MAENALLRRERLRRGLTQEQLAERTKLTARTIGRLEQGGRPRPDTIRLLTAYFKLPAEALGLFPHGRVESGPAALALPAGAGSDMQRRDVLGLLTATSGTLLRPPDGVGVDVQGTVYIADRENNRVRKVGTGGTITTFAGTGCPGTRRRRSTTSASSTWG